MTWLYAYLAIGALLCCAYCLDLATGRATLRADLGKVQTWVAFVLSLLLLCVGWLFFVINASADYWRNNKPR